MERGPVTNTQLMRARLGGELDAGVTKRRLLKHGQPIRTIAGHVPQAVKEAISRGERPTSPTPRALSIFISYATEERPRVLEIERGLRELGHDVWMDVYRLTTLEHLEHTIFAALRTSGYLVACLSSSCKKSKPLRVSRADRGAWPCVFVTLSIPLAYPSRFIGAGSGVQ